jgi:hypothetical protein
MLMKNKVRTLKDEEIKACFAPKPALWIMKRCENCGRNYKADKSHNGKARCPMCVAGQHVPPYLVQDEPGGGRPLLVFSAFETKRKKH